jgi:hypothetical protein
MPCTSWDDKDPPPDCPTGDLCCGWDTADRIPTDDVVTAGVSLELASTTGPGESQLVTGEGEPIRGPL